MALKKVGKLKDKAATDGAVDGAAGKAGADGAAPAAAKKTRAPGGRKSGRTWVIPRKRAEVIVQLAGNAGKDKLIELVNTIDKPDISVNNAANIKYALSQIAKKPEAYQHVGTQQFDRFAYAIAHKESALTDEDLVALGLVPEDPATGELMYHLVEDGAPAKAEGETAPAGDAAEAALAAQAGDDNQPAPADAAE